ncbi:MAG: hypothetical protein MHM6MM_000392 [Cercozoa sp. M6MM]
MTRIQATDGTVKLTVCVRQCDRRDEAKQVEQAMRVFEKVVPFGSVHTQSEIVK